jgi:hypothetical protein
MSRFRIVKAVNDSREVHFGGSWRLHKTRRQHLGGSSTSEAVLQTRLEGFANRMKISGLLEPLNGASKTLCTPLVQDHSLHLPLQCFLYDPIFRPDWALPV